MLVVRVVVLCQIRVALNVSTVVSYVKYNLYVYDEEGDLNMATIIMKTRNKLLRHTSTRCTFLSILCIMLIN